MQWNLDNGSPLYLQIADRIKLNVVSGKYPPNEKLNSVRDLAEQAGVNPNTMQRALSKLESEGLLYTNRTNGRYVTEDMRMIDKIKREIAQEQIKIFLNHMEQAGFSAGETLTLLTTAIKENV